MRVGLHNRMSTSKLSIDPSRVAAAEKDDWAKFVFFICSFLPWIDVSFVGHPPFCCFLVHPISAFARIENHYFVNEAFMRDGQLLDVQEIDKM